MKPLNRTFSKSHGVLVVRRGLLGLFALLVISYGLYETRGLLGGPIVEISEPTDGFVTASSTVFLKGRAARASQITVNGRDILIDQNGKFSEELLLRPGHTILELKAVDSFQRKTVQQLRIIRTEGRQTKELSEPAS